MNRVQVILTTKYTCRGVIVLRLLILIIFIVNNESYEKSFC